MASSEVSSHPREPWQQCANKLNQSRMDIWRRSTSLWHNSKYRCHQTTVEAWHRSADTLSRSKTRCHQSTVDVLNRSANKWHHSTECLHRLSLTCDRERVERCEKESSIPEKSAPSVQSPHLAQTHADSQPLDSPFSPTPTAGDITTSTTHTIQSPRGYDSAEEQIRDILNLTDQVMYRANHTKQLKTSKTALLGDIELDWINSTVFEASSAARDLAKLVEPYRLDILKRKGKMRSAHRKSWTLVDCQSACERFASLAVHQERLGKVSRHLLGVSESKQNSSNKPSVDELVPELPAESLEPSQSVVELPSESPSTTPQSDNTLVELPENSPLSFPQYLQPIPRIIVTQAPDDSFSEEMEDPEAEIFAHENEETNDILYWDQTRDSIRVQQSESLSNIVAKMESTRSS